MRAPTNIRHSSCTQSRWRVGVTRHRTVNTCHLPDILFYLRRLADLLGLGDQVFFVGQTCETVPHGPIQWIHVSFPHLTSIVATYTCSPLSRQIVREVVRSLRERQRSLCELG